MAEIYVPIDYSNVRNVIPPGEEIIYSTLCRILIDKFDPRYITKFTTWVTHLLITKKGIAYSVPQKKKPDELVYIPLYDLYHTIGMKIFIGSIRQVIETKREPNFESKEKFKDRKLKLCKTILPLIISEKEAFLNSYESSNIDKKKKKKLIRMKGSLIRNYRLYNKLKEKGRL